MLVSSLLVTATSMSASWAPASRSTPWDGRRGRSPPAGRICPAVRAGARCALSTMVMYCSRRRIFASATHPTCAAQLIFHKAILLKVVASHGRPVTGPAILDSAYNDELGMVETVHLHFAGQGTGDPDGPGVFCMQRHHQAGIGVSARKARICSGSLPATRAGGGEQARRPASTYPRGHRRNAALRSSASSGCPDPAQTT